MSIKILELYLYYFIIQFSDLFDNVKQSAINLANSASNVNAENGELNSRRNNQKWIKRKVFSKHSTPKTPTVVRRSARIFKDQRYK